MLGVTVETVSIKRGTIIVILLNLFDDNLQLYTAEPSFKNTVLLVASHHKAYYPYNIFNFPRDSAESQLHRSVESFLFRNDIYLAWICNVSNQLVRYV
jgi:hypothetical protein